MDRYAAHRDFIAPAVPTAALWRVFVGFLAASAVYLLLNNLFFTLVFNLLGSQDGSFYDDLLTGKTPVAMFILLGSFGLMTVGIVLVARVLHKRSLSSLIGPMSLAVPQFGMVVRMLVIVGGDHLCAAALGLWRRQCFKHAIGQMGAAASAIAGGCIHSGQRRGNRVQGLCSTAACGTFQIAACVDGAAVGSVCAWSLLARGSGRKCRDDCALGCGIWHSDGGPDGACGVPWACDCSSLLQQCDGDPDHVPAG